MTFTPPSRSRIEGRLRRAGAIATAPIRSITRGNGDAGRKPRTLLASFGRLLAVAGVVLSLGLSLSGAPAAAVTTMNVRLHIETFPGVSLDNNKYRLDVDVFLPSNLWDGQGYINNGAKIQLNVMGADSWFDDHLLGPYTYARSNGLFAQDDGIHLRVSIWATFGQLNEDTFPEVDDEIYIQAKWIDGAGATINSKSNEVSGNF
jgi:hypothetical protein